MSRPVSPQVLEGHPVALGGTRGFAVTRTLPNRARRTVGAWCFADSYGPHDVQDGGMRVPAHPHIGLQTVSWLLSGEIMHRDSLGSAQLVRPGQLNLMTAGHGIAHSEVSTEASPSLHGVQLWVALPDAERDVLPAFDHHADLPVASLDGAATAVVLLGEFAEATSPARAYTPIVGAEITVSDFVELPLRPDFEYALLGLDGSVTAAGSRCRRTACSTWATGSRR